MTMVPVPAKAVPVRVKAILGELERVSAEYTTARSNYEGVRVQFEAARERFASIKRIASEMLGFDDWCRWQEAHPTVRYAGMSLGEGILEALRDRAYELGAAFVHGQVNQFSAAMTLEDIVEALEAGGFEFRTPTPRREVNAALLKQDGVTRLKSEDQPDRFECADAADILQLFEEAHKD